MTATTTLHRAPARAERERPFRFRSWPVRWRILSIAVVNTLGVLVLALFVWQAAGTLADAWSDLNRARDVDRQLISLRSDAERVQSLIHRYFTQPTEPVLAEINGRRTALLARLDAIRGTRLDEAVDTTELTVTVQRLFSGFEELKTARAAIVTTYEQEVLGTAQEMSGLYALIDNATPRSTSLIWPALGKSREALATALVSVNAFYLTQNTKAAFETRENIGLIERTVPFMVDLADNELQRSALRALLARAEALQAGFNRLASGFSTQSELLKTAVDDSQTALASVIDRLSTNARNAELAAQGRFDEALSTVAMQVAVAGMGFMAASILMGLAAAASISTPLGQLKAAMGDIVAGKRRDLAGLSARDEIGDMARALGVFQENAIARRRAEAQLRAEKDRAEATLQELKETQATLIDAEKLAALGSLVAGVAHEVNNPVGISLTVASSLARRCDAMEEALGAGPLRRSALTAFIGDSREAATQLVTNLQRAGELVQAFKQVAVDRTHAERRGFDLAETTRQIVASLLPGVRKRQVGVEVRIPDGIVLDSYPGPYGQVITNLFLNCVTHAFREDTGTVRIEARWVGESQVCITFSDDGQGMTEEVLRRVFEPFFTTRRGEGGTGLGLHIVYNIVTFRLGGRITVDSEPGGGTRFQILVPTTAPREPEPLPAGERQDQA